MIVGFDLRQFMSAIFMAPPQRCAKPRPQPVAQLLIPDFLWRDLSNRTGLRPALKHGGHILWS